MNVEEQSAEVKRLNVEKTKGLKGVIKQIAGCELQGSGHCQNAGIPW